MVESTVDLMVVQTAVSMAAVKEVLTAEPTAELMAESMADYLADYLAATMDAL